MKQVIKVKARPSLALVKYWGKAEGGINLPATPSIGITLDGLETTTIFSHENASGENIQGESFPSIHINGTPQDFPRYEEFFNSFLSYVLKARGNAVADTCTDLIQKLKIDSHNNFPTAAGLASSSSGFGSLAFGLNEYLALGFSAEELSSLARVGSGSAARTLFGGFSEFPAGSPKACQLAGEDHWPEFRIIILTVDSAQKKTSSRKGMALSKETSPFYKAWENDSRSLFTEARNALLSRDIEKLGDIARLSYLRMFSTMFSASPPFIYWQPKTLEVLHILEELRAEGIGAWETMDAGPQVKVITTSNYTDKIVETFQNIVSKPIIAAAGKSPEVVTA